MAGKCSERQTAAIGAVKEYGLRNRRHFRLAVGPDPESMNTGESFFRIVGTILKLAAVGFIDVGEGDRSKALPELLVFYRN